MQYDLKSKQSSMWGDKIKFTVNMPISSTPRNGWPLLLFLHGFNSDEEWLNDNWKAHIRNIPPLRRCVVVTPMCAHNRWWIPSSIVDLTHELLAMPKLQADPTRTYIMGHSMGAYCTWSILSTHPSLFAAAVPISGGGRPDDRTAIVCCNACACTYPLSLPLFFANVCHDTRSDFKRGDLHVVTTFVWGVHGKEDTIVPFQETVRNIQMLPAKLTRLTLYENLAHDNTLDTAMVDINFYHWMLSKKNQIVTPQRMSRS